MYKCKTVVQEKVSLVLVFYILRDNTLIVSLKFINFTEFCKFSLQWKIYTGGALWLFKITIALEIHTIPNTRRDTDSSVTEDWA